MSSTCQPDGKSLPVGTVTVALPCKATNRQGQPCGNYAVEGMTVCKLHGGLSTGAPVQNGRFTKYLPARLRERYEEIINDPSYVSMREQIGLLTLRLQALMQRSTEQGDHGYNDSIECRADILKDMDELVAEMNKGLLSADMCADLQDYSELPLERKLILVSKAERNIREIRRQIQAIQDRARSERREDEIHANIESCGESLRKLKETEVKRMVAANQVLTVTESYNLIQRLVTFIEDYVEDLPTRARAIRELHTFLERRGGK